jgi:hypothetical protein
MYSDGVQESLSVQYPPNEYLVPDLMPFKGTRRELSAQLGFCVPGETVYVMGFAANETQSSFRQGTVVDTAPGRVAVAADVDPGYIGAPVLTSLGHVMGIVKDSLGTNPPLLGIIPIFDIIDFVKDGR